MQTKNRSALYPCAKRHPKRIKQTHWFGGYADMSGIKPIKFSGVAKAVQWLKTAPIGSTIQRQRITHYGMHTVTVAEVEEAGFVAYWQNEATEKKTWLSAKQLRILFN